MNVKKPENPQNLLVAATLKKSITYVFAESPFRNAEVRGSIPLCSTNYTPTFNPGLSLLYQSPALGHYLPAN